MKITIESTPTITHHNGTRVRQWIGTTERGVKCLVFVAGLAVPEHGDQSQFQAELEETDAPSEVRKLADVLMRSAL